jgi:hypothetical protein
VGAFWAIDDGSAGGMVKTLRGNFFVCGPMVVSFGAAGMIFGPPWVQRVVAGRCNEGFTNEVRAECERSFFVFLFRAGRPFLS